MNLKVKQCQRRTNQSHCIFNQVNNRSMKEPTPYQSIKLLNLPGKENLSHITTHVFKHSEKNNKDYMITIRSCSDRIILHGNLDSDHSVKNALHKIDTIISELEKMKIEINKH